MNPRKNIPSYNKLSINYKDKSGRKLENNIFNRKIIDKNYYYFFNKMLIKLKWKRKGYKSKKHKNINLLFNIDI